MNHVLTEYLEQVKQRKEMYLSQVSLNDAISFLAGFGTACHAMGITIERGPNSAYAEIISERGWEFPGAALPTTQMEAKGLSTEAMIEELFNIEIEVLKRLLTTQSSRTK